MPNMALSNPKCNTAAAEAGKGPSLVLGNNVLFRETLLRLEALTCRSVRSRLQAPSI